jgi:hypothetical protein
VGSDRALLETGEILIRENGRFVGNLAADFFHVRDFIASRRWGVSKARGIAWNGSRFEAGLGGFVVADEILGGQRSDQAEDQADHQVGGQWAFHGSGGTAKI